MDQTAHHTVVDFLAGQTPAAWLEQAMANIPTLLIDHAHCEKKAAGTALKLMFRYVDRMELLVKLAQLAREEMLHFEQVLGLMERHGIKYAHLSPARYANGLRAHIRDPEPDRLIDTLIIGAFIEARSCERFAALVPLLAANKDTADIGRYYQYLLRSESRHFQDYLDLAQLYAQQSIDPRVEHFRQVEQALVEEPDTEFRFHSGPLS